MTRKKNLIANLPSGIGITRSHSGRGRLFYRVRLGRRFTGGAVLKKDFSTVEDARVWIFGGAQGHKAEPGAIVDLKAGAGESAFKLSAAQLAEAEAAFRTCDKAGLSLTEAVRFAVLHAKPPAGVISIGSGHRGRPCREEQKQATYVFGGSRKTLEAL